MYHNMRKERRVTAAHEGSASDSSPDSPQSQPRFQSSVKLINQFHQRNGNTIQQIASSQEEQGKNFKIFIGFLLPFLIIMLIALIFLIISLNKTNVHFKEIQDELKDVEKKLQHVTCTDVPEDFRFDCHPESSGNEHSCLEREECCWKPTIGKKYLHQEQDVNVPPCFYNGNWQIYDYENLTKSESGNDFTGYLKLIGKSPYLEDLKLIKIKSTSIDSSTLRIKIDDPTQKRYEPPLPKINIKDEITFDGETLYRVELNNSSPGFTVKRKSDGTTLFKSDGVGAFIFADQFLEMSSILPSHNIYGLGEHKTSLKLSTKWKRFTFFNADKPPKKQTNLYGSHPFYLVIEKTGNCHGVLFLNSNAMDIVLQPAPAITFRSIGGIFDFFFFMGPTPEEVLKQYSEIVGKPFLPPYWSLGFHLSRFGYGSLEETKATWNRTREAQIPFDTQWNGLDYMDDNNVFTYDKVKYKDLPEFVKELQSNGMHYIPLINAGISVNENKSYIPYHEGLQQQIFINDSNKKPFTGKVWNLKSTVWPDFTNNKAPSYYSQMLKYLHENIPFDGVWLDLNEPVNFALNECSNNKLDNPQFLPHIDDDESGESGESLSTRTLCMNAEHQFGSHYNLHNTYGTSQASITYEALKSIRSLRPFIVSRSTWIGHGSFAGHWTGDIESSWQHMKESIPQILSFGFFQIPMVGADICGFHGNTTINLCNRWMQLGAFYPFSRNHNSNGTIEQDPVKMGDLVTQSSRESLKIRYRLLPYLYTLFYRAHRFGETVARPLFFEFIQDEKTYEIDTQFLWGSSLMIVPVLEEGALNVQAYVPEGKWYNYYTNESIVSSGQTMTLDAPQDRIPLLVRAGSVLPEQEPGLTTTESRKNKIGLLVALNDENKAQGELYWDDGETTDSLAKGNYVWLNFAAENGTLMSSTLKDNRGIKGSLDDDDTITLGHLKIMGTQDPINAVFFNNLRIDNAWFDYNEAQNCLVIRNLHQDMAGKFNISWTFINTNNVMKLVGSKVLLILLCVANILF